MTDSKDNQGSAHSYTDSGDRDAVLGEGIDFALEQLCQFLGIDPTDVSWDAATETTDGDVRAVIGNILRSKFGEDWGPNAPAQAVPDATTDKLCVVEADLARLQVAVREACDFLAERTYGSPARSPGHNARVRLERALAAAPRASGYSAWRPIETAPKDGREVLLKVSYRAGIRGKFLVGHYMPGGHCIDDHPPIGEGWYFWNGCYFDEAAKPLEWMPLPPDAPALPSIEPETTRNLVESLCYDCPKRQCFVCPRRDAAISSTSRAGGDK